MTVFSPTDTPPPPRAALLGFIGDTLDACDLPDEDVWLPVLGPTAWCVGRLIHFQLASTGRSQWTRDALTRRVGIAPAKLTQTLKRLLDYGLFTQHADDSFTVKMVWGTPRRRRTH